MSQPWNDINDPGVFKRKTDDRKSTTPVEPEPDQPPAATKQEPEVKLISAEWEPGEAGVEFNKKCPLKITAEFLKETFRKKVTCDLFVAYNGAEEDLNHSVDAELEDDGTATAPMTLYYGQEYYKALQDDPEATCHYKAKVSHPTAAGDLESDLLDMPQCMAVDFIEIADIHFHHNCALPCLDEKGELIGLLGSAFSFAKDNSDRELIIEGHADTSGDPDYNLAISKRRAEAIKGLLENDMDLWNGVVTCKDHKLETEDYQQTLKGLAVTYGWPCDPGDVDNKEGPKTKEAVKGFQAEYNSRCSGNLKPDGVVGPKTWEAIGITIRSLLEEHLKTDLKLDPAPTLTYGYPDGNGIYPCGESCPIENAGDSDYKSEENRRVELVFYKKDDPTPAIAPAAGRKIGLEKDPVSEKKWKKQKIEPASIDPPPLLQFVESESTFPEYWDPFLKDAPQKVIAAFSTNVAWQGETKAVLLKGTQEFQELPIASPNTSPIKIEWTGLDTNGARVPEDVYTIKLQLIKNGSIAAERPSSPIKLIRIGVNEISFNDSFPIRIYQDVKQPDGTIKNVDFKIPVPQWKIASLNDNANAKQRELPVPSLDGPSTDPDNFNYPVCYALNPKSPAAIKIAGNGFSQADSISVKLLSGIANAECLSSDNQNIAIDSIVNFQKLYTAIDSIQETKTTLTFQFEHTKADNSLLSIGSFTVENMYVYSIISKPQEPWNNNVFTSGSDLWLSVLRLLCSTWAKGLKDTDAATSAITDRIFNSGFQYDTDHGASFYTSGRDNALLKLWLKKLSSNLPLQKKMNCTDCATILTCLANAMGCELFSSRFDNPNAAGFGCHKIISIGFFNWDYPFSQYHGGTSGGFSYHEIGWKNGCTAADPIFDPCLKTAKDPVNKPAQDPILPTNIKFDDYKPKLVVPGEVSSVEPDSSSRIRRKVL